MSETKLLINRAPVLTLWAAVVAERLGHDREFALTLGKAVAGLNAQSKGRRLGIYEAPAVDAKGPKKKKPDPTTHEVHLLGRSVPVAKTPKGMRAAVDGKPDDPAYVKRYLEQKFGESLASARKAMEELAASRKPEDLEVEAFALYEKFRPTIPDGVKGWGAKAELSLAKIRKLAT